MSAIVTPALFGVVVIVAFAVWFLRGYLDHTKIENAEGGKELFKDRYDLEKQSHDALKRVVKEKDEALEKRAIAEGPPEIRNVLVRLANGEQIPTSINPSTDPTTWGNAVLFLKNPIQLREFAALANVSASGMATTVSSITHDFTISAPPEAIFLPFTNQNTRGKDDKKE